MYIVDFIKNLTKKTNVGVFIWIILKILLITALFSNGYKSWQGILLGLGIYVVSMVIALSPIGEWILRLQLGCKKIKDPAELQRLEPLFREVYNKAKAANPELGDDVKMYISDDREPNAFATGRKTVCVTRGLLNYSDEHIKGVLAHEFGHLAHKDTDIILVVSVGNMVVNAIFVTVRVLANFAMICGEIFTAASSEGWSGVVATLFVGLGRIIADAILVLLMRAWTQIGVWLCMHSSRQNEYEADRYSYDCGYGDSLAEVLLSFGSGGKASGLFAALASSHPDNADRVAKLRSYTGSAIGSINYNNNSFI